jgi:hypothetical protein
MERVSRCGSLALAVALVMVSQATGFAINRPPTLASQANWTEMFETDCGYDDVDPRPACAQTNDTATLKACCEADANCGGFNLCTSQPWGIIKKTDCSKHTSREPVCALYILEDHKPPPPPPICHVLPGPQDCPGMDLDDQPAATPDDCCAACASFSTGVGQRCGAWTWDPDGGGGQANPTCYLKSSCLNPVPGLCGGNVNCTSGLVADNTCSVVDQVSRCHVWFHVITDCSLAPHRAIRLTTRSIT